MIPVSPFKGGGLKKRSGSGDIQDSPILGYNRTEAFRDCPGPEYGGGSAENTFRGCRRFYRQGRFPLLIVDSPEVLKNRGAFSRQEQGF